MKKLASLAVSLVTIVTLLTPLSANASSAVAVEESPTSSVKAYIDYLEKYSVQDAINSGVTDPTLAAEAQDNSNAILEQFLALPEEQQQLFVDTLNNQTD